MGEDPVSVPMNIRGEAQELGGTVGFGEALYLMVARYTHGAMATVCVCREGKLRGSREFRFYSRSFHGSGFQDELSPPSLLYNTKR